jgi:hypothetical protein
MPTQTQSGKAFEYALINQAGIILSGRGFVVSVVTDSSYLEALACFNVYGVAPKSKYSRAAAAAINHIISLEPRLTHPSSPTDALRLKLQPDSAGRGGDVRDVLFIRSTQNWEIGISAKNNHKALKHSRLSNVLDFGNSWVNVPCSAAYFAAIAPTFATMKALKAAGQKWRNQPNKDATFYQPILNAFRDELLRIDASNPKIPQTLTSYLVGHFDFYKVMKRARVVEILAFNQNGTLGKGISGIRPTTPIPRLTLPTQLIQIQMKQGSTNTLEMVLDQGWQLSFRIHSAATLVETSLKFDVNLVGNPASMYSNHIVY